MVDKLGNIFICIYFPLPPLWSVEIIQVLADFFYYFKQIKDIFPLFSFPPISCSLIISLASPYMPVSKIWFHSPHWYLW